MTCLELVVGSRMSFSHSKPGNNYSIIVSYLPFIIRVIHGDETNSSRELIDGNCQTGHKPFSNRTLLVVSNQCLHVHTCMHACMHAYIQTDRHTYIHT